MEKEHRREDDEHTLATITYLENVLNANNIRYNLDLAWNKLFKKKYKLFLIIPLKTKDLNHYELCF